jgi:FdhD protein
MASSIPGPPAEDPGGAVQQVPVRRPGGAWSEDAVAIEEPLEIRVSGVPYAVTLRTPGDDVELALGFLYAERVVTRFEEVAGIEQVRDLPPETRGNVVDVRLAGGAPAERPLAARLVTSACGLCGKRALETLAAVAPAVPPGPRLPADLLGRLPEELARAQRGFAATGGLHAAGLFDAAGRLLAAREDVGRHNAVDKVVGWALAAGRLPLGDGVLAVSGRAGFEILQKAWLAAIPIVIAVSAPSSLAVALAETAGITLAAFARHGRFNLYSGAERVLGPS